MTATLAYPFSRAQGSGAPAAASARAASGLPQSATQGAGKAPEARAGASSEAAPAAGEVSLPVIVRDKKGKLATGLTKEDFVLSEDGRFQALRTLSAGGDTPLTLGLVVDTSNSMRDALDRERSASRSLVDGLLTKPENRAFLLHYDREVELLQDLTPSKGKMDTSLGLLAAAGATGPDDSADEDSHSRGSGRTLYDAVFLAADELMRKQQGRKALLIFSDGQDRGSKETLQSAIEAAQRAGVVVYAVYYKGGEHTGAADGANNGGRGPLGGNFPRGGGGGYPGGGNPRGGPQRTPSEPRPDGKKILAQFASATGGWFYEAGKTENLEPIHAAVGEQLRGGYMLGYTPDKVGQEGGYHQIQLSVNKKELTVQAPPGYYIGQ